MKLLVKLEVTQVNQPLPSVNSNVLYFQLIVSTDVVNDNIMFILWQCYCSSQFHFVSFS